jgi:hypothetical protein
MVLCSGAAMQDTAGKAPQSMCAQGKQMASRDGMLYSASENAAIAYTCYFRIPDRRVTGGLFSHKKKPKYRLHSTYSFSHAYTQVFPCKHLLMYVAKAALFTLF